MIRPGAVNFAHERWNQLILYTNPVAKLRVSTNPGQFPTEGFFQPAKGDPTAPSPGKCYREAAMLGAECDTAPGYAIKAARRHSTAFFSLSCSSTYASRTCFFPVDGWA